MTDTRSPLTDQVANWMDAFASAINTRVVAAAATLFAEDCYWRDLVAFTWNIKTAEGQGQLIDMLSHTVDQIRPFKWTLVGEAQQTDHLIEAWFDFETATGHGKGHVRLNPEGKCWTFMTALRALKGHEEEAGGRRWLGTEHHYGADRKTWLEKREAEAVELGYTEQPYCLIIGGGQGGIALAARLRRLKVPTIVVERNARAGDSWRNRYKSLCLHDPVWYDHLPYLPFPDDWPVFTPKDKLGDWLEAYTKIMELNYWSSTECVSARYDESEQAWQVTLNRAGKQVEVRPKQLVFASGASGYPVVPSIAGSDQFLGEQHHSSAHPGGDAYRGKRCIVLGSNNSAHDICADLWEHGADVTMIQRSSTMIVRSDSVMELAIKKLYSEEAVAAGISTDLADLVVASVPQRVAPALQAALYEEIAARDAEFYDRLRSVGFLLDFGDDNSGMYLKYLRRGSGYYIDVGASELVANGDVKLRSGVSIERIEPDRVLLTNGEYLPADLIVYATGYGSMNSFVADIVSPEVADRVGKCWGLGSDTTNDPGPWEGELRNMWKPTQQPGLWFHGGNLSLSRHYSLYLALQIKARLEGLPTRVYGLQEVHHLR
ncbi:NAD(P)-binding domain-containing protein [Paraburkholderia megapolitana]|uniref:NAD(P)-binding domain-containing protein n=1 Tax=Paraburkholderia megapolitana TaxID=420953 RepID=UPI0038B76BEC